MLHAFKTRFSKTAVSVATASVALGYGIASKKIDGKITKSGAASIDTEFNFASYKERYAELKNGHIIEKAEVARYIPAFSQLMHYNPNALFEMLLKCKHSDYRLNADAESILLGFSLLDGTGKPNVNACEVLLSSLKQYDKNWVLETPYATRKPSIT